MMCWTITDKGSGVNLALATDLMVQAPLSEGDDYCLVAYFGTDDTQSTIMRGTKEAVTARRDQLLHDLIARQNLEANR